MDKRLDKFLNNSGKSVDQLKFHWKTYPLNELGILRKGKGILKEQIIYNGLPCVRYGELYTTFNYKIENCISYIDNNVANDSTKISYGDILFAGSGETIDEIGKSAVYTGKITAYAGGDIIILSPNELVNSVFLSYTLETDHVKKQKRKLGQGQQIVHIYLNDIAKLTVILPPLSEQKAIAKLLSTWDEAINNCQLLIVNCQLRKKWLMQNLLTGKKRLKGFDGEWKEYHLGDFFIERSESGFYNLPLLSIGLNGVYPQSNSEKKDTSNDDKSKYKRICPGDIGYNTMRMWQGRSALSTIEGIVSPAYTIVTPTENSDSEFFSYLFKSPKMMNLFWRNSQGLVDDTLNCKYKDFAIVKSKLPRSKKEQTEIAKRLTTADQEIQILNQRIEKLKEQKKWAMQVLLTGKKRLNIK
jgi:type I restriction enzyme S subunit